MQIITLRIMQILLSFKNLWLYPYCYCFKRCYRRLPHEIGLRKRTMSNPIFLKLCTHVQQIEIRVFTKFQLSKIFCRTLYGRFYGMLIVFNTYFRRIIMHIYILQIIGENQLGTAYSKDREKFYPINMLWVTLDLLISTYDGKCKKPCWLNISNEPPR